MSKLASAKVFVLEFGPDDPEFYEMLIRIDHLNYFDEHGEEIKDYDDSKWDGFYYWDYNTGKELIEDISRRLNISANAIEIADGY
ncbi:hypothetical protein [Bacillus gobiensis]|uniref:hypothetical protein n=1 Tax=Bacillus gobiensis TaxID=1441095 RepID=UPI003D1CF532